MASVMNQASNISSEQPYFSLGYGILLDYCQYDHDCIISVATNSIPSLFFIVPVVFCLWLDLTKWPQCLYQYKFDQTDELTWKKLSSTLPVLITVMIAHVPFGLITHKLFIWRGNEHLKMPILTEFLIGFCLCEIINDAITWSTHSIMHWPSMYKRFHKIHHEWTRSIGFISAYSHPVDHFVQMGPYFLIPILFKTHIWTAAAVISMRGFLSVLEHSGFQFPLQPNAQFHYYHHLYFNENFGNIGLADWLMGTSKNYQKSIEGKRNRISFSLDPIYKQYPDEKNNNE